MAGLSTAFILSSKKKVRNWREKKSFEREVTLEVMADHQPELCSVCEEYFAEFFCRKCDRKICQECDEVIHMIPEKTIHQRIQLRPGTQNDKCTPAASSFSHSPQHASMAPAQRVSIPPVASQLGGDASATVSYLAFNTEPQAVATASMMHFQDKHSFQRQLESTIYQQQTVLGQMQQPYAVSELSQNDLFIRLPEKKAVPAGSMLSSRSKSGSTSSEDLLGATTIPPDNPEQYYDVAPAWEADDDNDQDQAKPLKPLPPPPSAAPQPQAQAPLAPHVPSLPLNSSAGSQKMPPAAAAGISNGVQVPTEALAQLKETQPAGNEAKERRQSMVPVDTSVLRDKFVQRGAASFVAQMRATKENPDILVSLILTKEMLLVAKKPSYKTLHTIKFSSGLKCFPVPKDPNGLIILSSDMDEPLVFGCGQVG